MSKPESGTSVLLGFRRGGGLVFLIEADRVLIFQPRAGAAEDEPMSLIGVANREHVALVADQLTCALGRSPEALRPKPPAS